MDVAGQEGVHKRTVSSCSFMPLLKVPEKVMTGMEEVVDKVSEKVAEEHTWLGERTYLHG